MQKLDRLVWAGGISVTTFGVRIGIRVNAQELLHLVVGRLPAGWRLAPSPIVERLYSFIAGAPTKASGVRPLHLLYGDIQRLARAQDLDELFEAFEADLNFYVAQMARRKLFVHAGVVGWKGQAVVIPGRSFSGKTTLVREFLQAGAEYYSDEFAVLDRLGRIHPFARRLCLRSKWDLSEKRISANELGAATGNRPLPIKLVVLTHHKPGSRWRPKRSTAGRGILGLLANTLVSRDRPAQALAILQRAISQAQVLEGVRGEAKETVQSILRHLDGEVRDPYNALNISSKM
jgi:hypothetical protein